MVQPAVISTPEWQDAPDVTRVQRRTVRLLIAAQIVGGVGIGVGASVGPLLAEAVTSSESLAGIARTSSTLGAALFALPLAMLATRYGRSNALGLGWALSAVGCAGLVLSTFVDSVLILVLGMVLFGAGVATSLQSRFASTDLAAPARRARTLSLVVWSTTIGTVLGPNLSGPGALVSDGLGWPLLAGPFAISTVVLALASILMWRFLRPDPLLVTRQHVECWPASPERRQKRGVRGALEEIRASPDARLAFVTVVIGHTVMGVVMTMTPVHMAHLGASLTLVGLTISIHILGMYALSPVVGFLADRWGRTQVIVAGQVILLLAALIAGTASGSTVRITLGLFLLGIGWSCALIAGSTLLGESVSAERRTTVQGTADMSMNLLAATAAGISGLIQALIGFSGLNLVAALLVLPVLAMVVARAARGRLNAGN